MKRIVAALFLATSANLVFAAQPPITGSPTVDSPPLLSWVRDTTPVLPDLTEPTANRLNDVHGQVDCSAVDLAFTTSGNYHMALRDLWQKVLLPNNGDVISTYIYSTSPPIGKQQIVNKNLTVGNIAFKCRPGVAVAPLAELNQLKPLGLMDGTPVAIIKNQGNVILVKKGNPKHIKTVWDLGRANVRVVTPNPLTEPGSFSNYAGSIYQIALNSQNTAPDGMTADQLFNSIFNNETNPGGGHDVDEDTEPDNSSKTDNDDNGDNGRHSGDMNHQYGKWLSGSMIHHREVPWSIAYGHGDASVIFYHLALHAVRTFPDLFEIVPLGGTVDAPQPLLGNTVATLYAVPVMGTLSARQLDARARLMSALQSSDFTLILQSHGLTRP